MDRLGSCGKVFDGRKNASNQEDSFGARTGSPSHMGCRSQTGLVGSVHDLTGFFSFEEFKKKFLLASLSIMHRVQFFHDFTRERLGREPFSDAEIVDTCLQGMQEGVLDVCAQNSNGRYVWGCYGMSSDRWQRTCGLLERAGVASSILWQSTSHFGYHEFMAHIEYLWTDLKAVERYLMERCENNTYPVMRFRLVKELDRRRWHAGLRRAWLAACTI